MRVSVVCEILNQKPSGMLFIPDGFFLCRMFCVEEVLQKSHYRRFVKVFPWVSVPQLLSKLWASART